MRTSLSSTDHYFKVLVKVKITIRSISTPVVLVSQMTTRKLRTLLYCHHPTGDRLWTTVTKVTGDIAQSFINSVALYFNAQKIMLFVGCDCFKG